MYSSFLFSDSHKSSTQIVPKVNDSFDSSFFVKNGSDSSFISQISAEETFNPAKKLPVTAAEKPLVPTQSHSTSIKPAAVLKTTFLSEDSKNFDLPQKITPRYNKKPHKSFTDSSFFSNADKTVIADTTESIIFEHKKVIENTQNFDKIGELEQIIAKKEALIETLRTRNAKMVGELEEVHKRMSNTKIANNEENLAKIQHLNKKCDDYERKIQEFITKEKEFTQILSKKELELGQIDREAKMRKNDCDYKAEKILYLESEIQKIEENKHELEKTNENLKVKLENIEKALDMTGNHKNHLEQEIIRLEIFKRNLENEVILITEENQKNMNVLSKRLEDLLEESNYYKKINSELLKNNESLSKDYKILNNKLISLEEKYLKFDTSKDFHARSTSNNVDGRKKNFHLDFDDFDTFQHNKEFFINSINKKKKNHDKKDSFKMLFNQIMKILQVDNIFEIIPTIQKLIPGKKEKKLVQKLIGLINSCLNQEKNHKEITPVYIWKFVKKIFEEYAVLKNMNAETLRIRQYLGTENAAEKVAAICHEINILRVFILKLKQKLKLPENSNLNDIENAIYLN